MMVGRKAGFSPEEPSLGDFYDPPTKYTLKIKILKKNFSVKKFNDLREKNRARPD